MKKSWRIDKSLLEDSLKAEIENKLDSTSTIDWNKVINKPQLADNSWRSPVATIADLPSEGNIVGDLRLILDTSEVHSWNGATWDLIGANDTNVDWSALSNKPTAFPPSNHTHSQVDITDLTKEWSEITNKPMSYPPSTHNHDDLYYGKTEIDNKLSTKVDVVAGKSLSTNDFTDDDKLKLDSLTDSATVDYSTMNQNLTNHMNDTTVHVTQSDHDAIGTIGGKADKTYVDNQLANKADSSTLSGHTGNTTIHVTQTDKDTWNGKSNFSGSYSDLTEKPSLFSGSYTDLSNKPNLFSGSYADLTSKPTIPTNTSQLTNDSGFLTSAPDEITIGATQPTSNLWYKVVG